MKNEVLKRKGKSSLSLLWTGCKAIITILTTTDYGVGAACVISLVGVAVRTEQLFGVIVDGVDQLSIRCQRVLVQVDDFLAHLLVLGLEMVGRGFELVVASLAFTDQC